MNRQSGSQLPIPVTPKESTFNSTPTPPPLKQSKRRSREGRSSWLFPARQRVSPIWRPSLEHTPPSYNPPTPQWPLPRMPINIENKTAATRQLATRKWTQPRDAPLPPPPITHERRNSSSSSSSSSSTTLTAKPPPPPPPHPPHPRAPTSPLRPYQTPPNNNAFQTRYMNMLLSTNKIPRSHNILSNLFAFLLLLAFVTTPANFVSPSHRLSTPLLAIDIALLALGALGTVYLALCWRHNYIWLMNRVYLPLTLNSLAGILAAVTDLAVRGGQWRSAVAVVALAVEGAGLIVGAGGFLVIERLLLGKLRREHERETERKTVVDLVKAGQRPPFAPGSVV